jgi:hypothetical protein
VYTQKQENMRSQNSYSIAHSIGISKESKMNISNEPKEFFL